jgi:hypothetical protein
MMNIKLEVFWIDKNLVFTSRKFNYNRPLLMEN